MTTTGGCTHTVGFWSDTRDCGKPVKGEGLCARHLAGKKRSEAATAKSREKYNASEAARENAVDIGRLLSVYGITSAVEYDWRAHRYTGKVVVDGEAVLKALKDMAATR